MTKPPKLDYETPTLRRGHSRYTLASICMGVAVLLFTAFVLVWDDPFESQGNEKPARIAVVAGILGIILAARGGVDTQRDQRVVVEGILLNVVAIVLATVLLPHL